MKSNLTNLIEKRKLVYEVVRFRLKATTVDNRLGVLWWLVDPILTVLVYWIVFSVIRGTHSYEPYPVFIGCAVMSWKFFSRCLSNGVKIFKAHGPTMRSIPFPTIVLPIALVIEEGVLFLFGLISLFVIAVLLGCEASIFALQLIPLFIIQSVLMVGISLLSACLGGFVYDLNLYTTHIVRLGFYLSPSLYGLDLIWRFLSWNPDVYMAYIVLNPFAMLFSGYRMAIWSPEAIPLWWYAILSIHAILFCYLGFKVYRRLDRKLLKMSIA